MQDRNSRAVRRHCALASSPVSVTADPKGTVAKVRVGNDTISSFSGTGLAAAGYTTRTAEFNKKLRDAISARGYATARGVATAEHTGRRLRELEEEEGFVEVRYVKNHTRYRLKNAETWGAANARTLRGFEELPAVVA
jgi:hypothetical protein